MPYWMLDIFIFLYKTPMITYQWPVSYDVFHCGWWIHATFWPLVRTVTFNIWGQFFSLSSGSLLIWMHQTVLFWRDLWCSCSVHSLLLFPVNSSCFGFPIPALFCHLRETESLHLGVSSLSCCLETLSRQQSGAIVGLVLFDFCLSEIFILHCLIPNVFCTVF